METIYLSFVHTGSWGNVFHEIPSTCSPNQNRCVSPPPCLLPWQSDEFIWLWCWHVRPYPNFIFICDKGAGLKKKDFPCILYNIDFVREFTIPQSIPSLGPWKAEKLSICKSQLFDKLIYWQFCIVCQYRNPKESARKCKMSTKFI